MLSFMIPQNVAAAKLFAKFASMNGTIAAPKSVVDSADCATAGRLSQAISGCVPPTTVVSIIFTNEIQPRNEMLWDLAYAMVQGKNTLIRYERRCTGQGEGVGTTIPISVRRWADR